MSLATGVARASRSFIGWQRIGFLSKRLEKGTFAWPKPGDGAGRKLPLRSEALSMLMDGIDLQKAKMRNQSFLQVVRLLSIFDARLVADAGGEKRASRSGCQDEQERSCDSLREKRRGSFSYNLILSRRAKRPSIRGSTTPSPTTTPNRSWLSRIIVVHLG